MALRARRNNKMEEENNVAGLHGLKKDMTTRQAVLGLKKDVGIKKEPTAKRGALGEISNRSVGIGLRQSSTANMKNAFKDVQAKVVTRRINSSKAIQLKPTSTEVKPVIPKVLEIVSVPSYSSALLKVESIDTEEDPIYVATYVSDIYKYLHELENKFQIRPDYLTGQEVTKSMRTILIDWLTEVHMQFHLLQETLYLAVAIIDRFLQDFRTTDRKHLQLVGVAAMSLACKYEEMYAPEIGDYVYICDNTYTKAQILKMEGVILQTLKFHFGRPIPLHFLRRFSKASNAGPEIHTLAKYFMELSLSEYKMCHLPPSIIAAAAIFLAQWLIKKKNKSVWTNTLEFYSTYTLKDITPIVRQLAAVVINAVTCKRQATRTKYASSKFLSISRRPELASPELKDLADGSGDF